MKKKLKLSIIVTSSVVAAILIVVMILSFVKVTPMDYFKGYERVALITDAQYEEPETEAGNHVIKKALNKTDFSIMHALLEGKTSYSPKLVKEGGEVVYLYAEDLKTLAPSSNRQMLKFYYATPKTIKVGGEKIIYDRMVIEYSYGNGEIVNVTCTAYLEKNVNNSSLQDEMDETGFIGSIYYKVPQFKVRMYTSDLYNAIKGL